MNCVISAYTKKLKSLSQKPEKWQLLWIWPFLLKYCWSAFHWWIIKGKKWRASTETAGVSSKEHRFCSDVSQMKRNYEVLKVKSLQDGIPKRNLEQFLNILRGEYMPPPLPNMVNILTYLSFVVSKVIKIEVKQPRSRYGCIRTWTIFWTLASNERTLKYT